MVWHSYMLNPQKYLDDALRCDKMSFWETNLPWSAINASIDNETFEYQPSQQSHDYFEAQTGLLWVNPSDLQDPMIECPRCDKAFSVPWTDCHHTSDWSIDQPEPLGTGFADKNFETSCTKCGLIIDHEMLKVQKFRKDIGAFHENNVPMAGTSLNSQGI